MGPGITKQRITVEAAIDRSVIYGTLIVLTGERRDFAGWLELTTALEAALTSAPDDRGTGLAAATTSPISESRTGDASSSV